MIDKVIFPLTLAESKLSATFYTTEKLSLKDKVTFIKEVYPYVLTSINERLKELGMIVRIYSFTHDDESYIVSLATSEHIIKLKLDEDIFSIGTYSLKDNERISHYKLDDLTDYYDTKKIADVYNAIVGGTLARKMETFFDLFEEILIKRFVTKKN